MDPLLVEKNMEQLQQSLEKLKALRAWGQLKQEEARRNRSSAFRIFDPVQQDIQNQVSHFLYLQVKITRQLQTTEDNSMSKSQKNNMRKRLYQIQQEFLFLNTSVRFIKSR